MSSNSLNTRILEVCMSWHTLFRRVTTTAQPLEMEIHSSNRLYHIWASNLFLYGTESFRSCWKALPLYLQICPAWMLRKWIFARWRLMWLNFSFVRMDYIICQLLHVCSHWLSSIHQRTSSCSLVCNSGETSQLSPNCAKVSLTHNLHQLNVCIPIIVLQTPGPIAFITLQCQLVKSWRVFHITGTVAHHFVP